MGVQGLKIRKADPAEFEAIWVSFCEIVSVGESYFFAPDTFKEEAFDTRMTRLQETLAADLNSQIVGTYFLKANQSGLGNHVCNCGHIVASRARGKGIASAMCEHSQVQARERGFKAMHFNFVVSTNEGAIRLRKNSASKSLGPSPRLFGIKTSVMLTRM
jgi:hypothetical protein